MLQNMKYLMSLSDEERTLYLLRHPEQWPNGNFLALRAKERSLTGELKTAIAYICTSGMMLIEDANIFMPFTIKAENKIDNVTPEQIIQRGWEVD